MTLRIVIDSAGDFPEDWLKKYQIHMIPINIHFGDKMFLQGIDLSNEGFYDLVDKSGTIPKTSQPTPQQFIDFYRKIADPGDTILSIHVTSKLSGTFESAEIAAREVKDEFKVFPFDSGGGSAGQGYMGMEARMMEDDGKSIEMIIQRLEKIREGTQIVLTLNTMEYARMSGRVKTLQAALASLLNVKPIVALDNGILDVVDKVRTRKKSLSFVLEMVQDKVGNKPINCAIVHAQDPEVGKELLEKARNNLNCKEIILTELSIGVAANLGPGTVGIIAYPVG